MAILLTFEKHGQENDGSKRQIACLHTFLKTRTVLLNDLDIPLPFTDALLMNCWAVPVSRWDYSLVGVVGGKKRNHSQKMGAVRFASRIVVNPSSVSNTKRLSRPAALTGDLLHAPYIP
jgi:hypothetical protein